MKTTRISVLSAVSVVAVLGAEPSEAATRWRVDGNICHGYYFQLPESNYYTYPRFDGIEFENTGGRGGVICPLPTGESIVKTSGTPSVLSSVDIRVQQTAPGAIIDSYIILNDYDSASTCTCGDDRVTLNSGYAQLTMPFDCGSCTFSSTWAGNIAINGSHNGVPGGFTKIKRISVTGT